MINGEMLWTGSPAPRPGNGNAGLGRTDPPASGSAGLGDPAVTTTVTVPTPTARAPAETITVYLLDDHEIVRLGLKYLLESEGDIQVIGESASIAHAPAQILALQPQVAVLDSRLPDGSGIDVCREIRSRDPNIATLILTSFDDDDALFAAIMAGAAGYVLKQIRGSDLIDSVRRVAAGQSLLDPAVTARVLDRVRQGRELAPALAPLTNQERRVLSLIGEGMTNRQIAESLFLAEKTVKNYVSSLLDKLGLQRRTQAALFAARHLPDPPT
jgi:two-component system, NarL family, response regulator DevR